MGKENSAIYGLIDDRVDLIAGHKPRPDQLSH